MYIEATRYAVLKERRMVSHNVSEGVEPRNLCIALGQGFLHSEASSATRDNGECVSDVPGSKSIAGHSTVHNGTWESHAVLERSLQQAEEVRRRYGSMAVGPTYIRGVAGVMSGESRCIGALEGVGSMLQRGQVP
jgi:hypothetical protein